MDLTATIAQLLKNPTKFAEHCSGTRLRRYQEQVIRAIVESIICHRGDTIVVMFPRQSGKNECQAQLEAYLMTLFSQINGEIVKASPTWKPQSINALRRLDRVLAKNLITRDRWKSEAGYARRVDTARIYFLSAAPTANAAGHTASVLLECDEAQDVLPSVWDKTFAPMAASTNATQVFWGTAWTSRTLLARELRAAKAAEAADGRRRAFVLTADDVAAEVAAYGQFVASQTARLGRAHPLIRTQFYSEEIDAEGGLFPPARRGLMQGSHPPQPAPLPGHVYAFLLDVAGGDEQQTSDPTAETSGRRDSTALTIVDVDTATLADELIHAPTYRVVARHEWLNVAHSSLYGPILALARTWNVRSMVIDATGIGSGLSSFLLKALDPGIVIPFVFNAATKSKLGWDFLAVVESGRFLDHCRPSPTPLLAAARAPAANSPQDRFWQQLEFVTYEAGVNRSLKWSVMEGTRDPQTGEYVHDDWVLSAALCAVLDEQQVWGLAQSAVIEMADPLAAMEEHF